MSIIRPGAAATLIRWREVVVGALVTCVGAWWCFGLGGLMTWIGGVVMVAGAALIYTGLQRGRFRTSGGGPGVVQIDEGRISYFGPLTGGTVALSELASIGIDPAARPPHWVLHQPGEPALCIPVNAEGADGLFDAFASLPGLNTEKMLAAMRNRGNAQVDVWQRDGR